MARRSFVSAGVAAAAAAVLALSACSPSGGSERPRADAPIGTSSAQGQAQAPAQAETPTPTQATGPVELTAANFVDTLASVPTSTSYDVAATVTADGTQVDETGSIRMAPGDIAFALAMTVPGEDGTLELRRVGGKTYLSVPDVTDGKFVVLDGTAEGNPLASLFSQLEDQLDPAASAKGLASAIVSVEKVGAPTTLDGVSAQQYEVVVDTSEVAGAVGDQLAQAGAELPDRLTYDYWVGADHRVRKLAYSLLDTTATVTFSNWGHGKPVVAPTADQITDVSPF
jgi:hypothetical protein